MRRFYLIGFLVLVAFDTFAQACFKLTADHAFPPEANAAWIARVLSTPWVYCAIGCYVGAFLTWMTLLEHAPIGPAFAASHLEVIGVMLLSIALFGETVGATQWAGAALILAGIVCLAISETRGDGEPPPA